MQRLFIVAIAAVIVLAAGFCVLVIVSLIPYFAVVGLAATGVVIVLLVCLAVLMIAFTWRCIGVWGMRRRTIIANGLVVYLDQRQGKIMNLTAELEQARTVKALPAPRLRASSEETEAESARRQEEETVLELYNERGQSIRDIAKLLGLTYYRVQQIVSKGRAQQNAQSETD